MFKHIYISLDWSKTDRAEYHTCCSKATPDCSQVIPDCGIAKEKALKYTMSSTCTSDGMSSSRISRLKRQGSVYDSVTRLLPIGDEVALRQALYSVAAVVLCVILFGVATCAYFVLQVFIKPLLWAVLCGSFLFPFKYALHTTLQLWLKNMLNCDLPLVVGTCLLPFSLFGAFSDWLGLFCLKKWNILSFIVALLISLYGLQYFGLLLWALNISSQILGYLWFCVYNIGVFVRDFNAIVLLILVIYLLTAYFFNFKAFHLAVIAMWSFLVLYILNWTGNFQVPLILLALLLILVGWLSGNESSSQGDSQPNEKTPDTCTSQVKSKSPSSINLTHGNQNGSSDVYFNILFVMFALVVVWMHVWILFLISIPLIFWICKRLLLHQKSYGLFEALWVRFFTKNPSTVCSDLYGYVVDYNMVLFPSPMLSMVTLMRKGDRKILLSILSSLPMVTSILIILIIFTTALVAMVFLTVKIQQESFLVVHITSNVINETVSQTPQYQKWLPDNQTMHKNMDSFVNTVYLQGREWISQKLHTAFGETANITEVEKQVLKLWDQLYQEWFTKKEPSPRLLTRQSSFSHSTDNGVVAGVVALFNMDEVLTWLQDNISALMSVGESLLLVIQSNVTLILSFFTTMFTTILNGSTIVLNFILSMVIFFTALFYLLANSMEQYKPLEAIGLALKPLNMGMPIEIAIEDAVSGVFGASLKMFGFYGLYTWVNHCLFGSNLVYIPSVLAAVFGVIPLLTTYWVCLPSALEIWLLQGSLTRAVGLVICQLLPTLFVDAAIYKDIAKSGGGTHPYITGLAVAGGVYSLGLEGAIIGPLILCFLLVALDLYTSVTTSNVTVPTSERS